MPFLASGGLLWGATPTQLWAVDPATGEVLREVEVDIPARIELASGSAWVSDSGSSLVVRIGY